MVLVNLVAHHAKTGLLDGHLGQDLGVCLCSLDHVAQDAVNLLLAVMRDLVSSNLAAASQLASGLDALKIEIKLLHRASFQSRDA